MHLHLIQTQIHTSGPNSHSCNVVYVKLLPSELCSEIEFFLKGMVINSTARFSLLVGYATQESELQNAGF